MHLYQRKKKKICFSFLFNLFDKWVNNISITDMPLNLFVYIIFNVSSKKFFSQILIQF